MKNRYPFFFSLVFVAAVIAGCQREQLADEPVADQNSTLEKAKAVQPSQPEQLATGLTPWKARSYALIRRRAIKRPSPVDYR